MNWKIQLINELTWHLKKHQKNKVSSFLNKHNQVNGTQFISHYWKLFRVAPRSHHPSGEGWGLLILQLLTPVQTWQAVRSPCWHQRPASIFDTRATTWQKQLQQEPLREAEFFYPLSDSQGIPYATWEAACTFWGHARATGVSDENFIQSLTRGFQTVLDGHAGKPETSPEAWQETEAGECVTLKYSWSRSLRIWLTPSWQQSGSAHPSAEY